MFETLDPADYRDVRSELFSPDLLQDARLALDGFRGHLGVTGSSSVTLDKRRFMKWDSTGLLFRCAKNRIIEVLAPASVSAQQLLLWRQAIERETTFTGTTRINRLLLSCGPVKHRWNLAKSGLCIYPAPKEAPRPTRLEEEHPFFIEMDVPAISKSPMPGVLAERQFEWWTLLLNAVTTMRCKYANICSGSAWTIKRDDGRSKWLELMYYPGQLTESSRCEALTNAREGILVDDFDFYVGLGACRDGAIALPKSLDETLCAAQALPAESKSTLRRACRLFHAADEIWQCSRSMSYMALVSAIEALAQDYKTFSTNANTKPEEKVVESFKIFLMDMLPCYRAVEDAAKDLYQLRCSLVHSGRVFPDDWLEWSEDTEMREANALFVLSRVGRLLITNWIRVKSGLCKIPNQG